MSDDTEIRGRLTFVRAATEDDADLLTRWHADPEVARYWDDERFTQEEMLERLRHRDVESYIVEEEATPVGYLQVWSEGGGAARAVDHTAPWLLMEFPRQSAEGTSSASP